MNTVVTVVGGRGFPPTGPGERPRPMCCCSSCGCGVGRAFGEYVERTVAEPFPYSPYSPASRKIFNLWPGRRFQIQWCRKKATNNSSSSNNKNSNSNWRKGRVVSFDQWNMGPFDYDPKWALNFELVIDEDDDDDDSNNDNNKQQQQPISFVKGDKIRIQGLVQAARYNGRTGHLLKDLNEKNGRYPVQLDGGGDDDDDDHHQGPVRISVRPQNLVLDTGGELSLRIHRMNIHGGGTLLDEEEDGHDPLISLEWLDPAEPQVDLSSDVSLNCPMCRAAVSQQNQQHQPPPPGPPAGSSAREEEEEEEKKEVEECPVCLQTKECRTLVGCNHAVCDSCWTGWKQARSGEFVPPQNLDMEDLAKERAKRNQQCLERFPCGLATINGMNGMNEWVKTYLTDLTTDADDDDDDGSGIHGVDRGGGGGFGGGGGGGLERLYRELMVEHMYICYVSGWSREFMLSTLSASALKVYIHVLTERFDEFHSLHIENGQEKEQLFGMVMNRFYCVMGEKYEAMGNPWAAVPWYEAALDHAHKHCTDQDISTMMCNLGLAQKRCGRFADALTNYDKSIQINPRNAQPKGNRDKLLREMDEWTGTSGRITPGC